MKWFYDMVEADSRAKRKRARHPKVDDVSSTSLQAWQAPPNLEDMSCSCSSASSSRSSMCSSPPSMLFADEKEQIRSANRAFQADWGLGETSSLLPLPLERQPMLLPEEDPHFLSDTDASPGGESDDDAFTSPRSSTPVATRRLPAPKQPRSTPSHQSNGSSGYLLRFSRGHRLSRYVPFFCRTIHVTIQTKLVRTTFTSPYFDPPQKDLIYL